MRRLPLFALLCALSLTAPADPAALARDCAACHGPEGVGRGRLIPNISGQKEAYLKRVLIEFKHGIRRSLIMGRLVGGYADRELEAVAAHFAGFRWVPSAQQTDPRRVEHGRQLARQRCISCHGVAGAATGGDIPFISGQWSEYLQLELERLLDPQSPAPEPAMRSAVAGLDRADLEALAQFYASQPR